MKLVSILFALLFLPYLSADDEAEDKAYRKMMAEMAEARVLIHNDQDAEAEKALQKFIETYSKAENRTHLKPETVEALIMEADLALLDLYGQSRQVEKLLKYSASKRGKSAGVNDRLFTSQDYLWQRKPKEARAELENALKAAPKNYLVHHQMAKTAMAGRDFDTAVTHFEKTIELNEDFAEPYYYLGQIYMRQKDKAKVREYWNGYIKRVPRKGKRYEYVNNTLQKLGGA